MTNILVRLVLVTKDNVEQAIHIVLSGFPGELQEVVQSFYSSTRPREQWTLEGAKENIDKLEYYLGYIEGKLVGITGIYTLNNAPNESWLGWTIVYYPYRRRGFGKCLVESVRQKTEQDGQTIIRAWVIETPSNRFGGMHKLLAKEWDLSERFDGQQHTFGEYRVYSRGLNDHQTTPYPAGTIMAGGSNNPIQETSKLLEMQDLEARCVQQNQQTENFRQEFKNRFGTGEAYVNEHLIDLTADIADIAAQVNNQVNNPVITSLAQLNEKSFPLEQEREIVLGKNGLNLYVQADQTGLYAPNERRILAVLDEQGNTIGFIVFGSFAFPLKLRQHYGVDGFLGITYATTDINYRGVGIAKEMVKRARRLCIEFLQKSLGIDNPKIMELTEQNDPMTITLNNAIEDWSYSLVGLTQRQAFWGKLGHKKVHNFNYVQVSLRKGLESLPLGLYVKMPYEQESIPSEVLEYCVKSYAHLALNKQQPDVIYEDDMKVKAMKQELAQQSSFKLNDCVEEFIQKDTKIMAALKQESVGGLGHAFDEATWNEKTLGELLQEYEEQIKLADNLQTVN